MKLSEKLIQLKAYAKSLPLEPGVYRYFDVEGNIIYVGKAKALRNRVGSYFQSLQQHNNKTKRLVASIDRIEYTVVNSEYDALLLENNLIKRYQPKYNISLKDGKSYPYILIINERFPRIIKTRTYDPTLGEYFGPYIKTNLPNIILALFQKIFFIRSCSYNLSEANIEAGKYKVCMDYHIQNCLGPCEALQSEEDYMDKVQQARNILKGEINEAKVFLKKLMDDASQNLEFEKAHLYQQKHQLLYSYQQKSEVVNPKLGDLVVFTISSTDKLAFVNHLLIKNGNIIGSENFEYKKRLDESDEEILLQAIAEKTTDVKTTVLSNIAVEIDEMLVVIPQIGDKKKLVNLSLKNAMQLRAERSEFRDKDPKSRVLEQVKQDLRLPQLPTHIECFDNSNIQGTNPVASMVCFKLGKPSKRDYRHFKIKTVEGANDFDSMTEIVYRRYKRLVDEKTPLPQLIIIDGGKGQLSAALKSIDKLGIRDQVTIVGIAKRLEEIYYPGDTQPLLVSKKSESLKLIQQLRNEAHRFAITFHRDLRSKNFLVSEITQIEGIGKKTYETLIAHFKTVKKIKNTSFEDLSEVVGTSKAQILKDHFEK